MPIDVPFVRSMLFVPANKTHWVEKGIAAGADAVVLDLEDAVSSDDKELARASVEAFMGEVGTLSTSLFVRINDLSSERSLRDLEAVVSAGLTGVMLPKVQSRDDVVILDRMLGWLERARGLNEGGIRILPVMETANGIRHALSIAQSSARVAYMGGLGVKGGDVERSIGYRWSPEGMETLVIRSNVLLDSRAASIPNPLTGLWSDVRDLDGLREFATQSRNLGYEGMLAIHPSHVAIINEVFTPTATELARDEQLVHAMEQAALRGDGATTLEGEMIDEAMAVTARNRLAKFK